MDTHDHGFDYCQCQRVYASIIIFNGEHAVVAAGDEYPDGGAIGVSFNTTVVLSCLR